VNIWVENEIIVVYLCFDYFCLFFSPLAQKIDCSLYKYAFILFQEIVTPSVLYEEVVEVDCRVVPALPGRCMLTGLGHGEWSQWCHVTGTTGEELLVCQELNEDTLRKDLIILKEKGINSIAVVLAHSYMCV
jgi:N-methylhydantoinase A/oxoprolinase/acetone carboxylase beta subunit